MEELERIKKIAIELTVLAANIEDLLRSFSSRARLSLVTVQQPTSISEDQGTIPYIGPSKDIE